MHKGWIGFDLDGTLATYTDWQGEQNIGEPILPMIKLAKQYIADGEDVRLFTARACNASASSIQAMEQWCLKHLGKILPITCVKDQSIQKFYDDRAVPLVANTGEIVQKENTTVNTNTVSMKTGIRNLNDF